MKKFTLALLATLCIWCIRPNQSTAQEYEVGTMVFNAGIGIGGYGALGFGSPGFSASLERGITETGDFGVIGGGAYVGYRSGKYSTFGFTSDWKRTTFVIAPRATYHFTVIDVDNLDVYAAVQIDFAFGKDTHPSLTSDDTFTNVHPTLIGAARYYFNDNLAGFVELGANSLTYLTVGLSLRF